ncbi:MAG: thiamine phosphate synthase [Gemmatimonadota bacterium]|nr:thiamine phosphate synthase [Gemmatimonadota bacterium]
MRGSNDRLPPLHVLVSERETEDPSALERVFALLGLGPAIAVHIRARLTDRRLYGVSRELATRARDSGGWCVVNGRPDIALAAGAHAVQLGRTALSVASVRRFLSVDSGVWVGASVHAPGETAGAVAAGADFVVAGTAYETASHPGRRGVGVEGIGEMVAAASGVPALAIGGIGAERIEELALAGIAGVVVAGAVWDESDPVGAARRLVRALERSIV